VKRSFLFFSLLLSVEVFFSQQSTGILNMEKKLWSQYFLSIYSSRPAVPLGSGSYYQSAGHLVKPSNNPLISATFTILSGSMNGLANIHSHVKRLNYFCPFNTVTYIQHKSPSYSPVSLGNEGTVVAYLGKNGGAVWDSTCIYTDGSNLPLTMQGGIVNPPGNITLSNAYIAAMGPLKNNGSIVGNFYSTKLIGTSGNHFPGSDKQIIPNTSPFNSPWSPQLTKHDYSTYSFVNTGNFKVHSAGIACGDINGDSLDAQFLRGAHIVTGVYTSTNYIWSSDSMMPPCVLKSNGTKQLWNQSWMAWNQAGITGYVVMIGARQGATISNKGWQPIVYKTTNGGNTWALVNGMDFNSTGYEKVLNAIHPNNNNVKVPFFNPAEGIDVVVDNNDKLHIVSTVLGTASQHQDSLSYVHQYNINGENYCWPYVPGKKPYIFDFIGDGSGPWSVELIDSVQTECPGNLPELPGFSSNLWANNSQSKPASSGMRLQVSKTYQGEYLVYSWAESDTSFSSNHWNVFPNIRVRAMRVSDYELSLDSYFIPANSSGGQNSNGAVKDFAYFHYMSSQISANAVSPTSASFTIPLTVSNNQFNFDINSPMRNFYCPAVVNFTFPSNPWASSPGWCIITHVPKNKDVELLQVYPNPTTGKLIITGNSSRTGNGYKVFNSIGQCVASGLLLAQEMEFDFLPPGIYTLILSEPNQQKTTARFVISR